MTTDKILNQEHAVQFLRTVGIKLPEENVRQVIKTLVEGEGVLYKLYAYGYKRDGSVHKPICSKRMVYKIKKLYDLGELAPYVSFLAYQPYMNDLDQFVKNMETRYALVSIKEDMGNLVRDWLSELPLSLNYLDIADLSQEEVGVPHTVPGVSIRWISSEEGQIFRRFMVEDCSLFRDLQRFVPRSRKLWANFNDCKQLGGNIIEICHRLTADIRSQAEAQANLVIGASLTDDTIEYGLNRFFVWTIFADALKLFPSEWSMRDYHYRDIGSETCEVFWGDNCIAIVKCNTNRIVVNAHKNLRNAFNVSPLVNRLNDLQQQLKVIEAQLENELSKIEEYITCYPQYLADTDTL